MLFFLALVAFAKAQIEGKIFLYPNGLGPSFQYLGTLPVHEHTMVPIDEVPSQCIFYAEGAGNGSPYCDNA
jgi:hypothetical protein